MKKKQGPSRKAGPIEEEEPLVSRANSRMKEEHTKQNTPAHSQTMGQHIAKFCLDCKWQCEYPFKNKTDGP